MCTYPAYLSMWDAGARIDAGGFPFPAGIGTQNGTESGIMDIVLWDRAHNLSRKCACSFSTEENGCDSSFI